MMDKIIIYADGACRGNQYKENIGAYAYQLNYNNYQKEYACSESNTTNNKMELVAVIAALHALNPNAVHHKIEIYTDSQYVVRGVNEWCRNWIARGWKGVKNIELWKTLLDIYHCFPNISIQHVSGHSTNAGNNRVDFLCNYVMDQGPGKHYSQKGDSAYFNLLGVN